LSYLIDTNVISELRRRERGHPGVVRWAASVQPSRLYTSVLVIGEIGCGVALKKRTDPAQAAALGLWFDKMRAGLAGRILPVTEQITDVWAGLGVPDPLPAIDGLIAATALVHGLTVVTRNTADIARAGVAVLNPFASTV
jgi:hypothetical protein